MPIYPIVNIKTGEEKELTMTISEWEEWSENNKEEWKRNWPQGCASLGETGEWKDKLIKKHPGWNEVLRAASKSAGSQSKIGKI